MKTRDKMTLLIVIATVAAMTLTGCGETVIEPICYPWAPEGCTISRTDYNSPAEIFEYFHEHDSTRRMHDGDTLKIWGWVYYHGPEEPIFEADFSSSPLREAWTPEAGYIKLVPNEDHHGYDQHVEIKWSNTTFLQDHPEFAQNFDSYLMKKWYVTVKTECCWTIPKPCGSVGIDFYLIDMDTIPNN